MTDLNSTLNTEDIVDDDDAERVRLDQAGDRWMADAETRRFAHEEGLRRAVKSDLRSGRDWARERADLARTGIVESPVKATVYALGLGVLIGLLLRR